MIDKKLIASQCMIWGEKKKKRAWFIWTTQPTDWVFSVQKQLPLCGFIKHFQAMEQQGKRGPNRESLCRFCCFSVNKTCNSFVSVWMGISVVRCEVLLYLPVPRFTKIPDAPGVTGHQPVLLSHRSVLHTCAGSDGRAGPALGRRDWAGHPGMAQLSPSGQARPAPCQRLPLAPVASSGQIQEARMLCLCS